jgi:hypothetical protein
MRRRRQIRQNRRVFDRNLLLVIIPICNPCLDLRAVERAGDEPLMEGMLVVVPLLADRIETRDQAGAVRYEAVNECCLRSGNAYRAR